MTVYDFLIALVEIFGYYAIATILFGLLIYFLGPKAWDYFISSKIEIEKSSLELLKSNKGNVFNRLHERKLDAYTDLFSNMIKTYQKIKEYTSLVKFIPSGVDSNEFNQNLASSLNEQYVLLKQSYHNSIILVPEDIEDKIKSLFSKIDESIYKYNKYELYKIYGLQGRVDLDSAFKEQLEASKYIESEFPGLLDEMRKSFRQDILKHDN